MGETMSIDHNGKAFEYLHFMRVLREEMSRRLVEYKLVLGAMDLTVKEEDDRLIAVPGTYYKVIGMVKHIESKRLVRFEKEFLADILAMTNLDDVAQLCDELVTDLADRFFGTSTAEIEVGARPGSHGIKGVA